MANPTAPTSSAAPGIWTLDQAQQYIKAGTWPLNPSNWIGMLGDSATEIARGVAFDSQTNMYIVGVGGSGTVGQIAKYNPYGVIQWQRNLSITAYYSVATDSLNNVYVTGFNNGIQLTKYNSSGVLQFQKKLNASTGQGWSIACDSLDNMYIAGYADDPGANFDIRIVKYNSSGTLQWQRRLGQNGTDQRAYGVAVDASANVYIVGYSGASITNKVQLAKYNSSGTIQWQREVNYGSEDAIGYGVSVDTASNVYVASTIYVSGVGYICLIKYNTSGTLQWARKLGGGSPDARGVTVDKDDNVYICGYSNSAGTRDWYWAKYNSSGTIQWQRRLSTSTAADEVYSIKADLSDGLLLGGITSSTGNGNFLFARMPQDGSKTGTYIVGGQTFIYDGSGLSDSSETLTSSTSTLVDAATTDTETTTTATDAATTLTSSVVTI